RCRPGPPSGLGHPGVLADVRRTLDLDQSFRKAVDERVLDEEEARARLRRARRPSAALASGGTPEAGARAGGGAGGRAEAGAGGARAAREELRAAREELRRVERERRTLADRLE